MIAPGLTIELVPSTCWFSNVRSNVMQLVWDVLRREQYRLSNWRCDVCGGQGDEWPVECHELWQYDDRAHRQTLLGLTSLCPDCHSVKHFGHASLSGKADRALVHLARINKWTPEKAESYVNEAFVLWKRRSCFRWTLNLDWLTQKGVTLKETDRGTH